MGDTEHLTHEKRIGRVEQALVQLNHFTEHMESLDLSAWKAGMNADMKWVKFGLKLATAGAWVSPIAAALLLKVLLK